MGLRFLYICLIGMISLFFKKRIDKIIVTDEYIANFFLVTMVTLLYNCCDDNNNKLIKFLDYYYYYSNSAITIYRYYLFLPP